MGIEEYASINIPGVRGMWSLKNETNADMETYLVQVRKKKKKKNDCFFL
jgi:hypothetical protein